MNPSPAFEMHASLLQLEHLLQGAECRPSKRHQARWRLLSVSVGWWIPTSTTGSWQTHTAGPSGAYADQPSGIFHVPAPSRSLLNTQSPLCKSRWSQFALSPPPDDNRALLIRPVLTPWTSLRLSLTVVEYEIMPSAALRLPGALFIFQV